MEKRKPHYKLAEIQKIVSDPAARPFTVTALRGGLALGLTEQEMRQVVLALSHHDFYKAMTTKMAPQLWQDVYHGTTSDGIAVYIKVTGFTDGRPQVIQFKEK